MNTDSLSLHELIDTLPCGIVRCTNDNDFTLTYVNEGFLWLVGYSRAELRMRFNNSLLALIYPDDHERYISEVSRQIKRSVTKEIDYRLVAKDGSTVWVMEKGEPNKYCEKPNEFFCIIVDISDQKRRLLSLIEHAERDALTGLYNRLTSQALIEEYVNADEEETIGAVLMLDIDDFEAVNEKVGHLMADTVLSDLAGILRNSFRASDIVGRTGGDEMVVLMKDIPNEHFASNKAESLLERIKELAIGRSIGYDLSCSIGIAIYPHDGRDFATLYHNADAALYKAKSTGKSRAVTFASIDDPDAMGSAASKTGIESNKMVKSGPRGPLFEYAFNLMYEAKNFDESLSLLFTVIGQQFSISRIYILEKSPDGEFFTNTYEWCSAGIASRKELLSNIPTVKISGHIDTLRKNGGFFYCHEMSKADPGLSDALGNRDVLTTLNFLLKDADMEWGSYRL